MLRRASLNWPAPLAAVGLALVACLAAAAVQAQTSTPTQNQTQRLDETTGRSHGLIVKLRDGSTPDTLRARALSSAPQAASVAADTAEPMRQMLSASGLQATRVRAVGRAAHLLDFGGPLSGAQAQQLAATLRARPEVEWVSLNEREQRLQTPNDPFFAASAISSGQWWLRAATGSSANVLSDRLRGVPALLPAWTRSLGAGSPVVAVLDTGITAHPDLDAHVLPGHDFVSTLDYANDGNGRDADATDPGDWVSQADKDRNPTLYADCELSSSSWHGTVIAGVIGAVTDNSRGVAGVNWNARVLPVRVAGKCGAEVADIVDGMRWAGGLVVAGAPLNPNPARVLNISFGGSAACNAAYQDAIDELRTLGVVVVAAAGNSHGAVKRPANCRGVVGVAALNRDGFKASYSSFGAEVVVSTVGGDPADEGAWGAFVGDDGLLSLDNLGRQSPGAPSYGRHAGTSFAAPVVAGVVSLMLSLNPALTVAQVIDGLRRSARPHVVSTQMASCSSANPGRCLCTGSTCGAGIVDAPQSLAFALNPHAYVAPAWPPVSIDSTELGRAAALGTDQVPNDTSTAGANASTADAGGGALGWDGLAWWALAVAALALVRRRSDVPVTARTSSGLQPAERGRDRP